MLLGVALVLAQAGSWSSGLPPECAAPSAGRSANVWERAKAPELRHFCDLVASASSKLASVPPAVQAALDDALAADALLPGRAAPKVLQGRALEALDRFDDARRRLSEARALDAAVLDDPETLLAWARLLARSGSFEDAAARYRTLLPRMQAFSGAERAAVAVEAGLVAMSCGPSRIDQAVESFREALRTNQADAAPMAALGLALALDRRGDRDEARVLLTDRAPADPRVALSGRRAEALLAVAPAEANALVAIGLEKSDPRAARAAWEKYVSSTPAGPWAARARERLVAPLGRPQ